MSIANIRSLLLIISLVWLMMPAGAAAHDEDHLIPEDGLRDSASESLAELPASNSERITDFASTIVIEPTSALQVRETITVQSLGVDIRHGVYRDFPTVYSSAGGLVRSTVPFTVLSARRDGQAEPYHTEHLTNGVRVYLGDADQLLAAGSHVYELTYRTDRQLGFFADHDELFWNVTGQDWAFPIDSVSATVILPAAVPAGQLRVTSYTGRTGSRETTATELIEDGKVTFENAIPLSPGEGLSAVISFPKGVITPLSSNSRFFQGVVDNLGFLTGLLGIILILLYFLKSWQRIGKDPKRGTIIPEYEPPKGFSPAMLAELRERKFDAQAFAAALVELAVKGLITIEEPKKRQYVLVRSEKPLANLTPDETLLMKELFGPDHVTTVHLERKYNPKIEAVRESLAKQLQKQVLARYYTANGLALGLGVVLSALLLIIALAVCKTTPIQAAILVTSLVLINLLFAILLPRYNPEGRRLLDHAEGFEWFLRVTEQERFNFHHPPAQTTALFEKFLPYAIALGVANQWAKQFSTVFRELEKAGTPYAPSFYTGTSWDIARAASFSNTLSSSLSGTVSAAATPPGSSSGFGGGAGGGGGGGGGAGW